MAASLTRSEPRASPGRHGAQDTDRHIAGRIRARRVLLGLTQQQLAELIGVTYQQAHKYETGVNRLSAGRLHRIAGALDVEVGHFFEGLAAGPAGPTAGQRRLLELARDFARLPSRRHQEALCTLARALADAAPGAGPGREGTGPEREAA